MKGPQATPGVTVAYKTSSPRRQTFLVELKGKTIAEGYDELAADGKSFTETSVGTGPAIRKDQRLLRQAVAA